MANTALASVTRLPTAAVRKVQNPTPPRCARLIEAHGLTRLPNKWQKRAHEREEAAAVLDALIDDSAELQLIFTLLRCLPRWQARNVEKLLRANGDDNSVLGRLVAARALAISIVPEACP